MISSKKLMKIAAAFTATTAMAGYGVAFADASNNVVTVGTGETVDNVYGGCVYDNSSNRFDHRDDNKYYNDKVGGTSQSGDANLNNVLISGGITNGNVYGGLSEIGSANNNLILVSDSEIGSENRRIYGGCSYEGEVKDNTVFIGENAIINRKEDDTKIICGGYSSKGDVNNNAVFVKKDAVVTSDYLVGGSVDCVYRGNGNVSNNAVSIESDNLSCRGIWGGYSYSGIVSANKVDIDSGTISGLRRGIDGVVENDLGIFGGIGVEVRDNIITINGGIIQTNVVGGAGYCLSNNTININGGIFEGDIIGGNGAFHDDTGYAGYVGELEIDSSNAGHRVIENNIVNINGNPDLTQAKIYGANLLSNINYNSVAVFSTAGNTLNIYTKDITARNISGFENLNFYIPASAVNGSTMLTLTEGATDLRGTTINAGVMGGSSLVEGDTVTLLTNTAEGLLLDDQPKFGKLSEGVSLEYELIIEKIDDHSIAATLGNTEQSSASDNTVTLADTNYTVNGVATDYDGEANSVYGGRVSPNAVQDKDIVGGTSKTGNVVNNTVNIEGGKAKVVIGADLIDAGDAAGNASNNTMNIYDGMVEECVYAAHGAKEAINNVVNMQGGTVRDLHGGQIQNSNGNASGNVVTVSNGNITNFVVAGETYNGGNASGNRINIKNGEIGGGVWAGWAAQLNSSGSVGDVVNNELNIDDGIISGAAHGATSCGGNAAGNQVNIRGGKLHDVFGGEAKISDSGDLFGKAAENVVTVEDGEMYNIYGGYSDQDSASDNIITIKGGTIKGEVIGGAANAANRDIGETVKANDNTINVYEIPDLRLAHLRGGTLGGSDYASGNTLNIYTKDITAKNISGFETLNFFIPVSATNGSTMLTLTEGTTDLRGTTINAGVMGGSSLVEGDTVTLLTNTADGLLLDDKPKFGKLSEGVSLEYELIIEKIDDHSIAAMLGNSSTNPNNSSHFDEPTLPIVIPDTRSYVGNVVNIDLDDEKYSVNGKAVTYNEAADYILAASAAEDVLNNEVNVSSGTFTQKVWGAASDYGAVKNNKFSITGGTYGAGVIGAWSSYGEVTENSVSLSGATINGATTGAWSVSGKVRGNTLIIDSGRLLGDVTGARSESGTVSGNTLTVNGGHITGDVFGGWSTAGQADNNTVNINGGIIDCFVIGSVTADGNSTGNVMNISGQPNLTEAYLVGSAATGTYNTVPTSSGYTGHSNTLNIRTTGLSVMNIADFDTLNFYLPSTTQSGDTVLNLTAGTTSLEGMTLKAGIMGNSSLATGDMVTLVANKNGLANGSTKYERLSEGVSLDYDLTFMNEGNKVNMMVGNPIMTAAGNALKPQTAALEQAAAVPAVRLMNSVVDLSNNWLPPEEDSGDEKKDVAAQQAESANDFRIFGNMGASSLRTKTGNGGYVENQNWGMDLGWAKSLDYSGSKLIFAPIVDYGRAKYESKIAGVQGSGSTNYLAGGMIARKVYDNGFYFEGSFRYGRTQMNFASNDFEMMGEKVHVSYDATAPCWAGHLHVGKIFKIDQQSRLNIYGMYHHAHQGGMTANLSTGETYTFDAVDSGRLRIGARITRQSKKNQRFYSGLVYQYEFSGSARAHYKDYVTPDTSTSGSSVMMEMGWQYQPVKKSPWMVDLNVSGWAGTQKGVKAEIKLKKAF